MTINQDVRMDKYEIPDINYLFKKLTVGQLYTKPDLSYVYQRVVLDEESRKLTTINTSKGLFEYDRLPYGVSSSPLDYGAVASNYSNESSLPGCCSGDWKNVRRARSQFPNGVISTPRSRATPEEGEIILFGRSRVSNWDTKLP